jgi:Flp pilus assembly protein TadD
LAGALSLYRRLAEAEPREGRVYPPLIRVLAETGQTTESLRYARQALQLPTHTVDNFVAIGEASLSLKQFDKAVDAFRGAVFGLPGDAQLRALLARALMESGDFPAAELSAVEALQLNPRQPEAHALLGELRFRQKRFSEALEHLQIAVLLNPGDRLSKARRDEVSAMLGPSKAAK